MLYRMYEGTTERVTRLTIYTDSYLVRGGVRSGLTDLGDLLNGARHDFVLLEAVKFEEFGSHALVEEVPYAQVNLDTVLFAVTEAGSLDGADTLSTVVALHERLERGRVEYAVSTESARARAGTPA